MKSTFNYKFGIYLLITALLAFGLTVSLQSIIAAWSPPSQIPPDNNISAPIFSSSSVSQIIEGGGSLAVQGPLIGTRGVFTSWISADGDNEGIFISTNGNVGVGISSPATKLDVQGDMRIVTTGVRPECNATNRNKFWLSQGGASVADIFSVCLKKSDESYAWKEISNISGEWQFYTGSVHDDSVSCSSGFHPCANDNSKVCKNSLGQEGTYISECSGHSSMCMTESCCLLDYQYNFECQGTGGNQNLAQIYCCKN
ncbi:MAG: hypothetical protein BWY51_00569 [Parcubacteria group bacterium ADurb.Bin316]|nr:MAG: hypothetical protein BWY51_00569 [Parcubacteria group bacterium ADurb.Bin316]HOZ55892.1 hypothetical protein [bacterium]